MEFVFARVVREDIPHPTACSKSIEVDFNYTFDMFNVQKHENAFVCKNIGLNASFC